MNWLLIAYKYLLSFRKGDWQLRDYPVRLYHQATSPGVPPWIAQILNWGLVGLGNTPEEALDHLRSSLERRRLKRSLPRPGSRPPISIAATEEIERHGDFAFEFVERVVGVRPFFVSDKSLLADFSSSPEEMAEIRRKVAVLYGIDTEGMDEVYLWKILDLVQKKGEAS